MLSGLNKKTCSRACANKNRSKHGNKYGRPLKDKVKTQRQLKVRLVNERGEKCERCPYSKTKILVVHHKNRKHDDNRMENLESLCPNCHAEDHYL